MRKHAWVLANLAIGLFAVFGGYLVVIHRQDILDWWTLRGYTAPANIQQIADQDTMQGRGRDLFYASLPSIDDSLKFNQHCAKLSEKSIVLGCYTGQRIYVYDVTDSQLYGVVQVTAAHEMLHAAYERLDDNVKKQVNSWLQSQMDALKSDSHLSELIQLYTDSPEHDQLLNEMHSILGTEYGNLSPQLEQYYKQYFTNRAAVVALSDKYKSAFTAAQDQISELEKQLQDLKNQIDTLTSEVEQKKTQLDQQSANLNSLRTNPAAYNDAVPPYNALVNSYNAQVMQLRNEINQYNVLVEQHNSETAAKNALYNSLDSHYQTVQ